MTLIRAALAALLIAACAKGSESRAGSSESPPPTQPTTEPAAAGGDEGGSAKPEAPKVAIGADRVELIGLANKTLADTDSYTVSVGVPEDAAAGKAGALKVSVVPKKGWKLNKEFPTKLSVTPPDGVTLSKAQQGIDDAVGFSEKEGAAWHVQFTAASAGDKQFGGKFKFAVCTDTTCDPKSETLAFVVAVK